MRTKMAVWSKDPNVDPVGACIGARGARVASIVEELGGEKIDIVRYSEDPVEFISAALSPRRRCSRSSCSRRGQELQGHGAGSPAVAGHRQPGPERPG